MPANIEPRLPRGMRDILPQKMILRQHVIGIIEDVFERFGFEPLQTPALELSETLMGKYGPEAEKLIFDARHREGKEALSLRYDLSVPLSRVVAMYPELVKPFKRYQIAPVWRAERPQKGRYREFYQCDADIVGTKSMLADAEIIALIYTILERLGFKQFIIKLNNRKILTAIGEYAGVPPALLGGLYRSIDKLEKVGLEGVHEELLKNEVSSGVAERILGLISIPGSDLGALRERLGEIPEVREGINELEQVLGFVRDLGVTPEKVKVDFTMVRGLEYYTGPIYETVVTEPKIGSLTGGGRYDELIGLFSTKSLPATGTTVGIERIIDVMEELQMFPPEVRPTVTQVLITVFDEAHRADSLHIANDLRAAGINAETWLDLDGLGKQLRYAAAKGISFAVIIGPDEAAAGMATLRDLNSGAQIKVERWQIVTKLEESFNRS
jgi:histidyl-tRNA synthetase